MFASKNAGKIIAKIFYINRRLFNKFLKTDERILFSAEQRKILISLWEKEPQTLTDLSIDLGLAKNTLTNMLVRMEREGLITSCSHPKDGRKKLFKLTQLGHEQEIVESNASDRLSEVFYQGFTEDEIKIFENLLLRVEENLVRENDKI